MEGKDVENRISPMLMEKMVRQVLLLCAFGSWCVKSEMVRGLSEPQSVPSSGSCEEKPY